MRKLLAFAVLAAALGCSSSDSGSSSVTADQACNEFSASLCEQIQTCAPLLIQSAYGDLASCKTRAKLDCLQATTAPSSGAAPADISSCASAAKSSSCAALLNNDWPSQCMPKPGGVADGAPCGTDSQCKSGFCGLNEDKEVCGVCAAKPADGSACVRGRCPMGLRCSEDGSTCGKPVAAGGSCDPKKSCASGSQCFGGKCISNIATEGAACDEKNGPNCDGTKGLLCVQSKCMKITLVAAGAECGIKVEGTTIKSFTLCEKNGWCKGLDAAATPPKLAGTCEPAAADGAACIADANYQSGPGCLEPAECVNGKCALPDAATCK